MEEREYTCQYCKKDFVPKRRKIQRFCSASCRVSFHRFKNVDVSIKSTNLQIKEEKEESKTKIEQVSVAGVANAALGIGLVEVAKNILISEQDKPATKGDIVRLVANLKRYHKIKNMAVNQFGQIPHFDLEKGELVYFGVKFTINP
ncbi:hypothetical protein H9W90_10375 [Polaribacter pectinis]|uniref:Uncharacterized protein n=1 Tax=Polaribacter pectinis TaxID=2738844 RepID=A0A7G9L7K3_9FLAO|nr:hypothetical protein [Polaribacter pectinis]QNM84602.1 hypothetical protein H9W90_10375 [Polaribacter pectinis]